MDAILGYDLIILLLNLAHWMEMMVEILISRSIAKGRKLATIPRVLSAAG